MNPPAYSLYALTASQLGHSQQLVADPREGGGIITVKEYVSMVFGIESGGPGVFPGEWGSVGMLAALSAFYFACSYLGLRFLRHQKR